MITFEHSKVTNDWNKGLDKTLLQAKANQKKIWLSTTLELLSGNIVAEMLLFSAYINDGLCFEFFCEGVAPETFDILHAGFKSDKDFRNAVRNSGIIASGVQRFICTSFDDFDMWYHFLDGTVAILSNPDLTKMLPVQDRNLARSLLALWNEGKLDEASWDSYIEKAGLID